MKRLNVLCGLPYSGKSTWARRRGVPIVCPDEIRKSIHGGRFLADQEGLVWWVVRVMVRSLFSAGHEEVTLDACSVSSKRRSYWRSEEWESHYVVFSADRETCIDRAKMVRDDVIVPIIERMAAEWEVLNREEAFSAEEPEDQFNEENV